MKRVVRSLLLFFCTTLFMLSATVCVCVVRVHADGGTYLEVTNSCIPLYDRTGSSGNRMFDIQGNARIIRYLKSASGPFYFMAVSDMPFTYNANNDDSCAYSNYTNAVDYIINGTRYYFALDGFNIYQSSVESSNIPLISQLYNSSGFSTEKEFAVYYTYGAGAVDPVEPINWGLVDVEGYQTNIAGQGQAAIHNVDVITWDNAIDTEGNDITSGNVRIRILPGEYRGNSKNDLLSKKSNDFILDIQNATAGNVVPVTDGSITYKWSDVIDALNFSSMSIFNTLHDNDLWFKRGWIYEIRLEIDDYIGEWQSIYASTSSGVENDLTIVNTSVITQNTIIAIQQVNSLNNTTNTWVVNGQPVDPNPEQTPPESEDEKPWWVYLLEMINNTLGIQNEYINEGTDESIDVVNNFEDDHNELNTTVEDYDDIENNLVIDMNNNLEQIEVDSDLIKNNSFLSSARWVAEQYTTIVTDNPIGSILKFSLVLGFVMIFLGRFK